MKRASAGLSVLLAASIGTASCSSSHVTSRATSQQVVAASAAPTAPSPSAAPTAPSPSAAPTTPAPSAAPTTPAPSAAPTTPAPSAAPSGQGRSIVVIGHSGATGYDSDVGTVEASSRQNAADGRENSWATGTNPAVDSIYERLVARSPEYAKNQFNLAADGATVTDMISQADYLSQVHPAPAVVFVQGGDNDMKCDGTDAQNYAPFQASFTTLLHDISTQAPKASIYVLSMTISAATYATVIAELPSVKAQNSGGSPCAPFDANGNRSASGIAYQQDDIDHYDKAMAAACATISTCRYDNGAMQRISVVPADMTEDGNHLSVSGLRKYADLVWATFFQN